ncbi:MAG: folate family ECF transporter S component [Bacillota bacterium]|nr:folate family ECF transporter S component [Bacillota bacterium]
MKKDISMKSWITIVILGVLSAYAIRFNTSPEIYTGLVFALVGVLFVGFYAEDKILGGILGALVVGGGLLIRKFMPIIPTNKNPEKLAALMEKYNAYKDFLAKYFVLIILVAFVIGFIGGAIGKAIEEDRKLNKKFSTYRLTYLAIFVALSVVINTARIGSISFGGFPIILSGYFLGPVNGFIVGGVADIVGFIIRPSSTGSFNPLFALTSALTGLIPVLVTRLLKEEYPKYSFIKVLIGVFIGQMITSVIMVPFFRVILYGGNTFAYFAGKAFVKQIVSIPVYAFLVVAIAEKVGANLSFKKIRSTKTEQ